MSAPTLNSLVVRALDSGWAVNVGPWQDSPSVITPQPRRREVAFSRNSRRVLTVWAETAGPTCPACPACPEYLSGYAWLDRWPLEVSFLDTPQSVEQEVSVD